MDSRNALEIVKAVKWERTDFGFPEIHSNAASLTEDVMRSLGYTPGDNLFYTIEGSKTEYGEWPSDRFPAGFQEGAVRWHVIGASSLRFLKERGVSFPELPGAKPQPQP